MTPRETTRKEDPRLQGVTFTLVLQGDGPRVVPVFSLEPSQPKTHETHNTHTTPLSSTLRGCGGRRRGGRGSGGDVVTVRDLRS